MADTSTFNRYYLSTQDFAARHARVVITAFAIAFIAAASGIASLRLDLSFRPLFASGADIAAPTEAFEEEFGQSSGAWIVAILENTGNSDVDFLRETARLSDIVSELDDVTEVMSLTHVRLPNWGPLGLSLWAPIPENLLRDNMHEAMAARFDALLDGTQFVGWLVSEDGQRLLLGARLATKMDNLDARRDVALNFERRLRDEASDGVRLYFSGVSVVELAYERLVLRDQLIATAITSAVLMLLLLWTFGNMRAVIVCLVPVTLAIPATLGVMGWLGQPVTIINTVLPAIVLVIGVADAVHMLTAWLEARDDGADKSTATRSMLAATGKACLFTTITTMGGFLALYSAKLVSVGNFGLAVAVGILLAWIANQVLLPALTRTVDAGRRFPDGRINRLADAALTRSLDEAMARPGRVLAASLVVVVVCGLLLPRLDIVQRFNEELPAQHPVSVAQRILESDFGGFLGPEISIRKADGSSVTDDNTLQRLDNFVQALHDLPETHHAWSIADMLFAEMPEAERAAFLEAMKAEPAVSQRVRELIDRDNDQLAVIVRIGDIGTDRAESFRNEVLRLAKTTLGDAYDVEVVGQWWMAQHGMRLLLRDMLTSLLTAMLIVLPLMWIALRELRMLVAATAANLLPLALPLAFMAAAGITLRIGTAVVLAIALGIVVDNTIHIAIRIREQRDMTVAMRGTGRAVIFTTLAMAAGFLSMLSNELLAIRDMGLVAAVTILGAMLADLLLLPAAYTALRVLVSQRNPG